MAQGRAKRPHKKTKTGCMTCRNRRIKCDEAKPKCRQCTESLRTCEYQAPQTWLFKPRNPQEESQSNGNLVQSVSPLAPMGDANDKRSLQFWVEQAAPIFSCYFGKVSVSPSDFFAHFVQLGHSFWTQLLPQIGFVRPAIKHMLLATSSVVETAALHGVPLDQNMSYQSHYTKAIQATCSSPQVENVLMACLLFACCDFMKGSVGTGLHHIRSGLSIIDEWYSSIQQPEVKASDTARLIINAIGPIFISYIDKSPTYGFGDITLDKCSCATMILPSPELPKIAPFHHIHGAHHSLDGVAHHVARMSDWKQKAWTVSPPAQIQMLLDTWRMTLDRFESTLSLEKRGLYAVALPFLRVHHTMLSVMLRAATSKAESTYNQFDEEFQWVVDRYDDFAVLWARDETHKSFDGALGDLDYHLGLIPPLFLTATKCRDPAIRMAALKHLGSLRVEENNWTSCTAYVIARKIIQTETKMSIINNRVGLKDERDLIRPMEAYITDKRMTQASLDYAIFPFDKDSPVVMHETIDLLDCASLSSPSVRWPLTRILRIGGYQGGSVTPVPTDCCCGFHLSNKPLLYRPKT